MNIHLSKTFACAFGSSPAKTFIVLRVLRRCGVGLVSRRGRGGIN